MAEQGKERSKYSVIGFSLIMASVVMLLFFALNDLMIHLLGRELFDITATVFGISILPVSIAGLVLSIKGLVTASRKKQKGKAFSIVGIVLFIAGAVLALPALYILLLVMFGSMRRPAETLPTTMPYTEETTELTTTETTETEPKSPEFYENNDMVVFMNNNINENMSLLEIINAVDEACKETRDNDSYTLEFGTKDYKTYDPSAGKYVSQGQYYCFCIERWFTAEDGGSYKICISVLYAVNDTNKDFQNVRMYEGDVEKDFPDFFDYIRKSYAYNYAKTEKIARIESYMAPD